MKPTTFHTFFTLLFLFLFLYSQTNAQTNIIKGKICGTIYDADTKSPLIGANVIIEESVKGAATNMEGKFVINDVAVGNYSVKISYIGYNDKILTDIIVKSGRSANIIAELIMASYQTEEIKVTAGYFTEKGNEPVSLTSFSYEEIRRSPGAAGDVSRIVMSLPSVAKVNDQSNGLIVRGGSPIENMFLIDNIEIPNINHFPTQGASNGPLGLINVDFIRDINFVSGGFSSIYGDRLSSVMEINFREGNRTEFDGQLDLNFSGFGGVFEGPLFNGKGSWLLSARRSYLDLLVKAIDIGSTIAPVYGDYQGKIVYDINKNHQLTLLGIFGDDHNDPDAETAIENDMVYYGNQDIYESTAGINWRALWGNTGYSNTSVSYTSTKFKEDFFETGSNLFLRKNRSHEQAFKLRNVNHLFINKSISVDLGIEAKYYIDNYNNKFGATTDLLGNITPELYLSDQINSYKTGIFVNLTIIPYTNLTAIFGLRADYFSFNKRINLAPRGSLSYKVNDVLTLNASAGIYFQNLPSILLNQNNSNKDLKDPYSTHYVMGFNYLLTESTKLTLEVYQKDYKNFPADPAQNNMFIIDELYYSNGYFNNHSQLTDNGEAFSRGIELTIQKKLAKDLYGLISGSYFTSQYKAENGKWRKRVYDNRYIFSLEGGYKPNNEWELSARWIYAGGVPYTPFDIEASQNLNRGILDKNKINEERYPDYHSLNLRVDKRFHFKDSNLVVYISIWNVYNRGNIATTYWNQNENKPEPIYQWGILPIFGLEYEF